MAKDTDTYCTYEAVELAKIGLEHAKEALYEAQRALGEAVREHETAEAVMAASEDLDDEGVVEELADEGFDYETAEAIVRKERHDYYTARDIGDMTMAELRAFKAEGKASNRVMRMVDTSILRKTQAEARAAAAAF